MPKTDVRENAAFLGDLIRDFNFSQAPRPRLILNPCPAQTTLIPKPEAQLQRLGRPAHQHLGR